MAGSVPDGLLLVRRDKEFNIYLTTIPDGLNADRFYIIAYKSFDDKSKIKCIALRYIMDSERIVIYNNYLDDIAKVEGFGISAGDIERELKLNGQTFKLFNDAWHYIEDDWIEYNYLMF